MTRSRFPFILAALAAVVLPLSSSALRAAKASPPPNIVFILADDLGWHDVGFNGEQFFETPNLDRVAADGMRFTRAYSGGPNCLPMRACLISGMYSPRTQIWTPGGRSKGNPSYMKLLVPGAGPGGADTFPSKLALEPSVTSFAEVLKSAGYKTARFGKWHVGPDTQGFDLSDPNGKGGAIGSKYYGNINVAEDLTNASLKFITANQKRPFFLYLCHWDVHTPIRARPEVVAKYKAKLESDPPGKGEKKSPVYAAMIEAVDTSVARVRAKLDELGLAENTLFIFSSDNGGYGGITENLPLRGAKGSLYEGGTRVPTAMVWPKVIKAGSQCDTPLTSVDFLPTFAELSGAKLPTNQPVDGRSFIPLLKGDTTAHRDRAIFWHYPLYLSATGHPVEPVFGTERPYWRGIPASSMIKGDWKLIHAFEDNSLRLFNLAEDLGESRNLAASNPEKAAELFAELQAWQKKTKAVIPTQPNPAFDATARQPKRRRQKTK